MLTVLLEILKVLAIDAGRAMIERYLKMRERMRRKKGEAKK